MKTYLIKSGLLALACCMTFGVVASTPDGQPPAKKSVCSQLSGKEFGVCNAYCEAMDCDNPNSKASNKACKIKFDQWVALRGAGVPIPCENASLSLIKSAESERISSADGSLEVNSGQVVNYSIVVQNNGSLPVNVTSVIDKLADNTPVPLVCNPAIPALLHPADDIICTASATYNFESSGSNTYVDTASAAGATIGGYPVNAPSQSLTVMVNEPGVQCPCMPTWDNEIGATPLVSLPTDLANYDCEGIYTTSGYQIRTIIRDPIPGVGYYVGAYKEKAICQDSDVQPLTVLDTFDVNRQASPTQLDAEYKACKLLLESRGCVFLP